MSGEANSTAPVDLPAGPRPWIGPVAVDSPLLQSPMAGFSNYAYRQIVRRLDGVGLPATKMAGAQGLLRIATRAEGFPERLWGVKEEPRPLPDPVCTLCFRHNHRRSLLQGCRGTTRYGLPHSRTDAVRRRFCRWRDLNRDATKTTGIGGRDNRGCLCCALRCG